MKLKHSVYDTDTHFSINAVTRALKNESMSKTGVIQFDHNSERFTFEIPRFIEEHDMSLCDSIQVHYNNIDAQTKEQSRGVYEVDDMQISPDGEDVVILSWLISGNATKFVGSLNFLIRFACTGEEGHVYYVWNTAVYTGISVSSGIYNGDAVVNDYSDILNEWKKDLESNQIVDLKQTQVGSGDSGVNVWTATFGDGRTSNLEVKNGHRGDKGESGTGAWVTSELLGADIYDDYLNFVFSEEMSGASQVCGTVSFTTSKTGTIHIAPNILTDDDYETLPGFSIALGSLVVDNLYLSFESYLGYFVCTVTYSNASTSPTTIYKCAYRTGDEVSGKHITDQSQWGGFTIEPQTSMAFSGVTYALRHYASLPDGNEVNY